MRWSLVLLVTIGVVMVLVLIVGGLRLESAASTERFIKKWFRNDNGTLATYIVDGDVVDNDLVKGREALAETIGLWMEYALEKKDRDLFDESYTLLQQYFLQEDGHIPWKLTESGDYHVHTNALVDDLRIVSGLYRAYEIWGVEGYRQAGDQIGRYLDNCCKNGSIFADFYERKHNYVSDTITLSYIEPQSLMALRTREVLETESVTNTLDLLKNAPQENGFYPKSYHITLAHYEFEEQVNMIDQGLVVFYQSLLGNQSEEYHQFIKQEMDRHGRVYGVYNRLTKEPAVNYESPAVYGILIWYSLEIGDASLAKDLYERMVRFKNKNPISRYAGGYTVDSTGNTHIFDNLVPLLAEVKLLQQAKQ